MRFEISLIQLLTVCAVANGLVFSFLLLAKEDNRSANKFLALSIVSMCLTFTPFVLDEEIWNTYRWLAWMPFSLSYWIGPAVYFYVRILTTAQQFSTKDLWHFAPIVLNFLHSIYHLTLPYNPFPYFHHVAEMLESAAIISILIYSGISYRIISTYQAILLSRVSNIDAIDLGWLKRFFLVVIVSFTVILLFVIGTTLILGMEARYEWTAAKSAVMLFYGAILYWLSITGFRQAQLTSPPPIPEEKTSNGSPSTVIQNLTNVLTNEKLYRNPELSLQDLSTASSISERSISEAINNELSKNFYRYINDFRVDEVKSRLVDPQFGHLKILSIAEDAGFNSKATFNRIFKDYVGMTPQQYKSTRSAQQDRN